MNSAAYSERSSRHVRGSDDHVPFRCVGMARNCAARNRLCVVKYATTFVLASRWPTNELVDLTQFSTPVLATAAVRLVSRLRLADRVAQQFNLLISNVPGPREAVTVTWLEIA